MRNKDTPYGLMMTAGVHSTLSRRLISGGLVITLELNWDEFVHYQRRANAVYAEAMRQLSVRTRDVLMNAQRPHMWWSTLKSGVFGSSSDSSLPPLIGAGGGLVCESAGKTEMLSAHFDGKQSRDPVDLPSVPQSHYLCLQVTGCEAASAGSGFLW